MAHEDKRWIGHVRARVIAYDVSPSRPRRTTTGVFVLSVDLSSASFQVWAGSVAPNHRCRTARSVSISMGSGRGDADAQAT